MGHQNILNIVVIWRGKHLNIEVDQNSMVEELGNKLQKVTNVKPSTMRLLIPHPNRTSKLLTPFSDGHSHLSLQETAIIEGKPIRMLGVLADEIEEVSQNSTKADLRIAGFDEEEKRLRQRLLGDTPSASLKLPQGSYIFCDFQTLQIPGIELDPPPFEALRRMHMLACDPGIIAIMNKHRWRVGVMTEMAPVGYVGISPKCILGFNKNHGEEISLRIRTDDLKGFRKYESIKKTLLHELAHMVYTEHDASFFALDKQLNQEAASLDWTKSKSHTLSGHKFSHQYGDNTNVEETTYTGQKLGGTRNSMATARASSVSAAYQRFLNASEGFQVQEPVEGYTNGITEKTNNHPLDGEQLPDAAKEPDPDEAVVVDVILGNPYSMIDDAQHIPDDCLDNGKMFELGHIDSHAKESDPDDSRVGEPVKSFEEPDPDDSILNTVDSNGMELDPSGGERSEHDTNDHMDELHNLELQRIEESVAAICTRLQDAIKMLKTEATPEEAALVIQTLFRIIRNVIDHPNEIKFKRLRKANPHFQRNVVNYKAAMEVLAVVGFCEDVVYDEAGRAETFMVLKRNDPGLLWLAKSYLEPVA